MKNVTVLRLENMDHPRTIRIRVCPPEPFSVFYIHSIYKEPVVEEFQAEEDAIALKGVRTKSPPVMEYYGFEDVKEFHPIHRRLGAVHFMWGIGDGQGLMVRGRTIPLKAMGESGDRIQLRAESISIGKYLFSVILKFHEGCATEITTHF